jgi:hypothetical protein
MHLVPLCPCIIHLAPHHTQAQRLLYTPHNTQLQQEYPIDEQARTFFATKSKAMLDEMMEKLQGQKKIQ